MFQGPKGYIAQICEVHLQYGKSTLFSSKFHSNIYSILFDSEALCKSFIIIFQEIVYNSLPRNIGLASKCNKIHFLR